MTCSKVWDILVASLPCSNVCSHAWHYYLFKYSNHSSVQISMRIESSVSSLVTLKGTGFTNYNKLPNKSSNLILFNVSPPRTTYKSSRSIWRNHKMMLVMIFVVVDDVLLQHLDTMIINSQTQSTDSWSLKAAVKYWGWTSCAVTLLRSVTGVSFLGKYVGSSWKELIEHRSSSSHRLNNYLQQSTRNCLSMINARKLFSSPDSVCSLCKWRWHDLATNIKWS